MRTVAFVWHGSVLKVGNVYDMFASRWPTDTTFPDGYRQHSGIVRAEASRPEGPYVFKEVVIGRRAAGKWDSASAHRPAIYNVSATFVLFYIGSHADSRYRQIGIATASSVAGPWTRRDKPLDRGLAADATIRWTDGTEFLPVRRERPWLLIENGKITFLFNAVFDGKQTWNQPVPLATHIHLD